MEKDYKKLYEDAVEGIRTLRESWKSTGNRAAVEVESVFPQLSADVEREHKIRRVINEAIEDEFRNYICIGGVSKEDCLKYLELQSSWKPEGEQLEYLDKAITYLKEAGYLWAADKLQWLKDDLTTKL